MCRFVKALTRGWPHGIPSLYFWYRPCAYRSHRLPSLLFGLGNGRRRPSHEAASALFTPSRGTSVGDFGPSEARVFREVVWCGARRDEGYLRHLVSCAFLLSSTAGGLKISDRTLRSADACTDPRSARVAPAQRFICTLGVGLFRG